VPEIAFCEDVHLFTDGCCFDQHSSATRMAGWAVVQASCASVFDSKHSRALDWGVLPGLLQSAVRAEVYAIWRALQLVSHYSGRVFLWTDCEAVVKKFRRLLHGGTVRANSATLICGVLFNNAFVLGRAQRSSRVWRPIKMKRSRLRFLLLGVFDTMVWQMLGLFLPTLTAPTFFGTCVADITQLWKVSHRSIG